MPSGNCVFCKERWELIVWWFKGQQHGTLCLVWRMCLISLKNDDVKCWYKALSYPPSSDGFVSDVMMLDEKTKDIV